ncbi:MAG: MarR family transcriptional regulator [Demequinaceae bacterium]|nr:MarR family transcriptional regulator [Demequinaceae bacterium]
MAAVRPRTEGRASNDDHGASLFRILGRTSRAMRLHLEDTISDVPGGISAWSVLRYLHRTGPTTQAGIAKGICLADSTLTRRLDSMENDGLVIRTVDPEDKRRTIVALSEQGEALHDVQRERADAVTAGFVKGIAHSDLEALARVIDGIHANLLADGADPTIHGRGRRGRLRGNGRLNQGREGSRDDT